MNFNILKKDMGHELIKLIPRYLIFIMKYILQYNYPKIVDIKNIIVRIQSDPTFGNKGGYAGENIYINVNTDNINTDYLKLDLFNTVLHEIFHIIFPLGDEMKCYEELWIETLVYRYIEKYYDKICKTFSIEYDKKTYLSICNQNIKFIERDAMMIPNRKMFIIF